MKIRVSRSDIRVAGFLFSGVACGLKEDGRKDVALIYCERPAAAAGAFTTNRFAAPPVVIARERLRGGRVQAVLVNTKSANAGTGPAGRARALECCKLTAGLLGVGERLVVPCSTGKIGIPIARGKITRGIRTAVAELSPAGFWDAAEAIRTTDAFAKTAVRRLRIGARSVTVAGMAKGAGMIHPQMATTLCYVMTDAALSAAQLRPMLRRGLEASFNAISVDGDTSTNDTALLLASGAGDAGAIARGSAAERKLAAAVAEVLGELAHMIVADGEGARKVAAIEVRGARSDADADRAARAIANSQLVKCALGGADPNWGRIACALGYSGARFRPERVTIAIGGTVVSRGGSGMGPRSLAKARRVMRGSEFPITVSLSEGSGRKIILASDLGVRYVRFNSDYSS